MLNIKANKKAGELLDIFISIYVACNMEEYFKEVENVNLTVDEEFKNMINEIISILGDDLPKYNVYFNKLNVHSSLIDMNKIWELESLEEYLEYIKTKNEYSIQKEILKFVDCYEEDHIFTKDEDLIKEILNDNNLLIKFLSQSKIPHEDKWNVIEILNNIQKFKDDFIELIKNYESKYSTFIKKHKKEIDEFYIELENKINQKGTDIQVPFLELLNIKKANNVFIIPSTFYAYTILHNAKDKDNSYVVIGKYINKVFDARDRESAVEKYVSVFKNLGDLNRYRFIKLLSQGEKYAQEIAEELKITSATVNYHANNLFLSNLLKMERYENKIYYSLNKDTLRNMIEFIKNDLGV